MFKRKEKKQKELGKQVLGLPQELYDNLNFNPEKESLMELDQISKQQLILRNISNKNYYFGIVWHLIPTILSMLLVYLTFFFYHGITYKFPIYGGDVSISAFVVFSVILFSLPVFLIAYFVKHREISRFMTRRVYILSVPLIIGGWLLILSAILDTIFWLVSKLFVGLQFDGLTSAILIVLLVGSINALIISFLNHFSISTVKNLVSAIMIGGVLTSIINSGKTDWWRSHFSVLGSNKSHSSIIFNITLIFAGLLLALLFDYLCVKLKEKYPIFHIRLTFLHSLLILCSLSITGVSVPNNGNIAGGLQSQIHNTAAGLIVLFLVLTMAGLIFWIPLLGKGFYAFTYLILAVLLTNVYLFYGIKYLSLTAFEFLSFTLAFVWLLSFISKLADLIHGNRQHFIVRPIEEQPLASESTAAQSSESMSLPHSSSENETF